jgi:hypothetical protein
MNVELMAQAFGKAILMIVGGIALWALFCAATAKALDKLGLLTCGTYSFLCGVGFLVACVATLIFLGGL